MINFFIEFVNHSLLAVKLLFLQYITVVMLISLTKFYNFFNFYDQIYVILREYFDG